MGDIPFETDADILAAELQFNRTISDQCQVYTHTHTHTHAHTHTQTHAWYTKRTHIYMKEYTSDQSRIQCFVQSCTVAEISYSE